MSTSIVQVVLTLNLMTELLANRVNNRKIREHKVREWMRLFQSGKFADGTVFHVNDLGQLIDGQHRITALLRLGMTVTVYLMKGANIKLIDSGRPTPRTVGDWAVFNDNPFQYSELDKAYTWVYAACNFGAIIYSGCLSASDVYDYVERHYGAVLRGIVHDNHAAILGIQNHKWCSKALVAFMLFTAHGKNATLAIDVGNFLARSDVVPPGENFVALKEYYTDGKHTEGTKNSNARMEKFLVAFELCWNAHRAGKARYKRLDRAVTNRMNDESYRPGTFLLK